MEHWINLNMSTANTLYFFFILVRPLLLTLVIILLCILFFSLFAKMKDNIDFFYT
jgi:hypothetical protein